MSPALAGRCSAIGPPGKSLEFISQTFTLIFLSILFLKSIKQTNKKEYQTRGGGGSSGEWQAATRILF